MKYFLNFLPKETFPFIQRMPVKSHCEISLIEMSLNVCIIRTTLQFYRTSQGRLGLPTHRFQKQTKDFTMTHFFWMVYWVWEKLKAMLSFSGFSPYICYLIENTKKKKKVFSYFHKMEIMFHVILWRIL